MGAGSKLSPIVVRLCKPKTSKSLTVIKLSRCHGQKELVTVSPLRPNSNDRISPNELAVTG